MTTPPPGGGERLETRARAEIPDRLIAEAEQLHAEVELASRATSVWSGPAARRRMRAAKNAETDLLRVLGFNSYAELLGVVRRPAVRAAIDLVEPATAERDSPRTREIERALGAALAEIEVLRTRLGTGSAPAGTAEPIPAPAVAPLVGEIERLLGTVVGEIQRAAAEIHELRAVVSEVHELAVDASAQLILAKLEVLVAARRERAE
jgi:hypothetical protein